MAQTFELIVDKIVENLREYITPPERYLSRELLRLIVFSIHKTLGEQGKVTGEDLYHVGKNTGLWISKLASGGDFIHSLKELVEFSNKLGVGEIEVERESKERAVLRVYDCIICRDVPKLGINICYLPSGFYAGFLQGMAKGYVSSSETRCMANGSDFCEFVVERREIF